MGSGKVCKTYETANERDSTQRTEEKTWDGMRQSDLPAARRVAACPS